MRSIDIIVDRAGFYETWGCLVFVPSLSARAAATERCVALSGLRALRSARSALR